MQDVLRPIRFIRWLRPTAPAAGLSWVVATLAWAPAHATSEVDCRTIGHDAFQVDLGTTASQTRHVMLHRGETLRFAFEAEPGPFGTLTLIEGAGAPRVLLVGPSGSGMSFTARHGGAFAFQFTKDGGDAARFSVSCAPLRGAHRDPPAGAPALAPGTLPLGDGDVAADGLRISAADAAAANGGVQRALPAVTAPAGSGAVLTVPKSTAGAQMKLQWLDRRYGPSGADGPQIDTSASGVEIGINYKLKSAVTVGALAHFSPAAQMPFGAEPSLADQGWMAGPVATVRLVPGVVLNARAAWGEGESGPDEAAATAAQRRLLSARLANEQTYGGWRFTPSVSFNYLEEALHGPETAPQTPAPHAAAGRIDVGPELAYRMDLAPAAFIEPRAVVTGFWDFDSLSNIAPSTAAHSEIRLKAEAGVTIGILDGPKLQALGALEAGDREAPDAWSGRLQLSVPLK